VQSAASFEPLLDDYSTLDHASAAWDEHQQHLSELNEVHDCKIMIKNIKPLLHIRQIK
jgi:hypothetical protein